MIFKKHAVILIPLIFGLILHIVGKQAGTLQEQDNTTLFQTGPSSLIVQQAVAGPCLGLGAESNVLSIFSVYWSIDHKQLSTDDKALAWSHLHQYLQRAQSFDPWFWDIYRLTSGLLAYQDGYHRKAFDILERGAEARNWDWEVPFIAGFLAHDLLKDDALAFRMMELATHKKDTPTLVIGLAAKFLSKTETVEDSIQFLKALKKSMPEKYSAFLDHRIKELQDGTANEKNHEP